MSPEQAVGDKNIDARSDVYALGCVVYEMVSGRAPFQDDTPQALLAKHAIDTAPSLRTTDPSIPLFVERAVERALAKSPADRFQTASAFAEALTSEMVVARVGAQSWQRRVVVAAAVVVAFVAAAWGLFTFGGGATYERLAVLPPTNLTSDAEQEHIIQGMLNGLISELGQAGITVIGSVQSMMRYQGTEMTAREIAAEVGVDAVIEWQVLWVGDSVATDFRLTDGRTEELLWSRSYDEDARNVLTLYRQVTGAVAAEIRVALTPQAEARLATAREVDPQAYEAYLRGQFHAGKLTPPDLGTALQYYEVALEYDAEYALAYAGIAFVWMGRSQMGIARPRDALPPMTAAVDEALDLDSTLAEVQHALALFRTWHEWDWAGAEVAFERAIEINPNYADVRAFYSHFLCMMNRADEAVEQLELAMELDPYGDLLVGLYGMAYLWLHRYDEAIVQFRRLLQTVPNHPLAHWGLLYTYGTMNMHEEALAAARAYFAAVELPQVEAALDQGYSEGGYREAMKRTADELAALSNVIYYVPSDIASVYTFAAEHDRAIEWLKRGFEERDPNMPYLSVNAWFDGLRDDPRFLDLLLRMNLPQ
jgi:TolB-like protein